MWERYVAGQMEVLRGIQLLRRQGKQQPPGLPARTAGLASCLQARLNADANETMLLHGTKPDVLLSILSTGPNERFSGGLFGHGTYFAEDVS